MAPRHASHESLPPSKPYRPHMGSRTVTVVRSLNVSSLYGRPGATWQMSLPIGFNRLTWLYTGAHNPFCSQPAVPFAPRMSGVGTSGRPRPMTFDEQLKRAFDTLSERLHDEVARQVA